MFLICDILFSGQSSVSIQDFHEKFVRGNKTYIQVLNFFLTINYVDSITYDFENLTTTDLFYGKYKQKKFNRRNCPLERQKISLIFISTVISISINKCYRKGTEIIFGITFFTKKCNVSIAYSF